MKRRDARKHIFSIIFQMEFNKEENISIIMDTYNEEYEHVYGENQDFILNECKGINNNLETIDSTIDSASKGWNVERLSKVDLAILRIAVYEILFDDDIPDSVAANEAVELAKEFSSDKAPMFINGILGNVIGTKKVGQ